MTVNLITIVESVYYCEFNNHYEIISGFLQKENNLDCKYTKASKKLYFPQFKSFTSENYFQYYDVNEQGNKFCSVLLIFFKNLN